VHLPYVVSIDFWQYKVKVEVLVHVITFNYTNIKHLKLKLLHRYQSAGKIYLQQTFSACVSKLKAL